MKAAWKKELENHLETWGPNCGAPRKVYEGHLRELLRVHRAMVEAEASVNLIGEVVLCPDCLGTRVRRRDDSTFCCPIGHSRECGCALCAWRRAYRKWEEREIALRDALTAVDPQNPALLK